MLESKGRVRVDRPVSEWLRDAISRSRTVVFDLNPEIAARPAAIARDNIRDPADRIIVATALHHRVPLVTKDGRIVAAKVVPTIW